MRGAGVVAGDRVVGQAPQQVEVAGRGGVFEAAHPQVAGGDAGQHRAGQRRLALHRPARRHHGQGSRGGDAQRVHRLADDVLAQHRTRPPPGRRRRGRTASHPNPSGGCRAAARRRRRAHPAAARGRRPVAARSRRTGAPRTPARPARRRRESWLPTRKRSPSGPCSQAGSRPSSPASGALNASSRGSGERLGLPTDGHLGQVAGEAVLQSNGGIRRDAHPAQPTGGGGPSPA